MTENKLRIKELSYNEVHEIILQNDLYKLGRNEKEEERYSNSKNEIKKRYESLSDSILKEKFNLKCYLNKNNKLEVQRPLPDWTNGLIRTLPNDFPYYFQKDVKHLVLWKLGDEVNENDVKNEVNKLHQTYCFDEYFYFINPPHLKSIPEINHAHIILHLKEKNQQKYIKILRSTAFYGITGFSFLITLKLAHTGYVYHTFYNEFLELRKSLSIVKLVTFYSKYFVPFPLSLVLNYLLRRLQLTSS